MGETHRKVSTKTEERSKREGKKTLKSSHAFHDDIQLQQRVMMITDSKTDDLKNGKEKGICLGLINA